MKKAFVALGAFLIFVAPLAVFAADTFLGPIVPEEFRSGNSGPYLQACDLVELFDRALQFAVYFATLVATIMIVYAGFLYVTASANQDNLNKAKSVFGNVFIGFVVVLVAWLVVNLIMGIFTSTDFRSWNKIDCVEKSITPDGYYPNAGTIDSSLPGDPTVSCPACRKITSLNCKNPTSCSANPAMLQKIDSFAETLGDDADETIVTEAGPNTTLDHLADAQYKSGDTADIGCRNAGRTSSGGCTPDWVERNLDAWSDSGGSRAVFETSSQDTADELIRRGVDPKNVKVYPNCSTGQRPCITADHISIYN